MCKLKRAISNVIKITGICCWLVVFQWQMAYAGNMITLASGGEAGAVIVIPNKAAAPVRFAAEEIKHYLDQITGGDFAVVHSIPESGSAIILGAQFSSTAGIDTESLKRDGYVIKTIGNKIYIAGKDNNTEKSEILFMLKDKTREQEVQKTWLDRNRNFDNPSWDFDRGTLNGAYDFLERLGVRWFFPGDKGEIVPQQSDLSTCPINDREEPYFIMRKNGSIVFDATFKSKKNIYTDNIREEYDYLGFNPQNQRLWLLRNRDSSTWMGFNHRPQRQQWSQRFGKSNPEYFALLGDGSRATNLRCYLNYTNAGMLEETVKDMDAFFSGKTPETRGFKSYKVPHTNGWDPTAAYGDYFSLLPNDGLRVDQSPDSLKYVHEDKPLFFRHTNYIWQFINKAALELKKIHPDKFITCLAYQSYCEVPDPEVVKKLPDNVIVGIAALSGCSRINTFMIEKRRQEYLDLLQRWSKMSDAPMYFWTYWLYRHAQTDREGVPLLLPHGAQQFVKAHAPYGRHWFMEHDARITFELLNRYIIFRLLWNPDVDIDELLDDYCEKSFGPAATVMREMLSDIEKRSEANATTNADLVAIWERGFPAEVLQQYRNQINEAKQLTANTAHSQMVELMGKYFIQPMEDARKNYHDQIKSIRDAGKDIITAFACSAKAIKVDGEFDHSWKTIGGKTFYNNVNGQILKPVAKHRMRYTDKTLYFMIDIPALVGKSKPEVLSKDYVEIFLDTNHDRETYYWLQIFPDGKYAEHNFPGPGEPPLDWKSMADIKVKNNDNGWVAEIAIPLSSLDLAGKELENTQIGGLICITKADRQGEPDMFSSSSPILRGAFHQPGVFNRMRFVNNGY